MVHGGWVVVGFVGLQVLVDGCCTVDLGGSGEGTARTKKMRSVR